MVVLPDTDKRPRVIRGFVEGLLVLVCLVGLMVGAQAAWVPLSAPGQSAVGIAGQPERVALAAQARVLAVGTHDRPGVTFVNPDSGELIKAVALPDWPRALVIDAAGATAYVVTGDGSSTIRVIDVARGKMTQTWAVGGAIAALALNAKGDELIAADGGGKRLLGISPLTGKILRTGKLPGNPAQMALAAGDLRLLVALQTGQLLVLDNTRWTVLRTVDTGAQIHSLAWWSVGGQALVVQQSPDGAALVDIDRGTLAGNLIPLEDDPDGLAVDSGNALGYISLQNDNAIGVLDLGLRQRKGRYSVPDGIGSLVFDPVAQALLVTQPQDNRIIKLDPRQSSLITDIELPKRLSGIKVNNATDQAGLIAAATKELIRLNLSNNASQSLALPGTPNRLVLDTGKNLAVIGLTAPKRQLAFADLTVPALLGTLDVDQPMDRLAVDNQRGLTIAIATADNNPLLGFLEPLTGNDIVVVGNASRTVVARLHSKLPLNGLAVHSGKGIAYLVSANKKLALLNLDSKSIVNTIDLPFAAERIAIDEDLNLAVLTASAPLPDLFTPLTPATGQAYLLDLATLKITQTFTLPQPATALAIQPDTHVAVLASRNGGQLSLLDLTTNTLAADFAQLEKPFALGTRTRTNQALVLTADRDEITFVQLPNPLPVLSSLAPANAPMGNAALTVQINGRHIIDGATVAFGGKAVSAHWVNPSRIDASVPAELLTSARTVAVTVTNPAPAGGASNALNFDVLNPLPVLIGVAPASLQASGKDQIVTLSGAKFLSASQVFFGAQRLASTFGSAGQLSAIVPGALLKASGTVPVTVFNPAPGGGVSAPVNLPIVASVPTITGFAPTAGPVGTVVTITGTNFDALNPGANTVRFGTEAAIVSAVTATQLTVIVPVKAVTGPISVATQGGSVTSAQVFTVQTQQDFAIAPTPAALQIPRGGTAGTRIALASTGLNPYGQVVAVSATGLPAGITYKLDHPNLYLGQDVILTFAADNTAAAGNYTVNLIATGPVDAQTLTRTAPVTLTVLDAATTTVSGRVMHTEDGTPFVNARIRLGTQQAMTDATGTYRFVNPDVLGDQVLQIDGNTAATATRQYPSAIAMPVMIVSGQDNVALTSYIQGIDVSKYTTITPAAETHVTVPEIPNYELRIPAGAVLKGWDGTPVTQVNVRTVPVDRLPIKPLPDGVNARTVYLYYFFRTGGANPSQPIPVTMNNDLDALPGEKVDLWYYDESVTPDPNSNQWKIMGPGTVSQDGKSIVSDPGVGIPKFCCGASTASRGSGGPNANNGNDGGDGCGPDAGNPVDLASGNGSVLTGRAFGIKSLMPVNLSCRYRSTNPQIGAFGRGTSFSYDWFAEAVGAQAVQVTSPSGARYMLSQEGDGVYRLRTGKAGALGMELTPTATGRTLRFKNGTTMEFDLSGRLQRVVDTDHNQLSFQLDVNGFVQSVTDPNGLVYAFSTRSIQIGTVIYTVVAQITDPLGRMQQFAYDSAARLTSITDAGGNTTLYEYDAGNRIVKKTDPRGAVTQYAYDATGRTLQEILPDNARYKFDYAVAANIVTENRVTDPNGNLTTYRFSGQGYPTKVIDGLGRIFSTQIDYATNLVTSTTDALLRTTSYTYDDRGNRTSIVDPLGNTTLIDYDRQWNKPSRITDALGSVTSLQYDERGRLTQLTDAENETTRFAYTSRGQLASVTDALGHVTRFDYDGSGNRIKSTDALGDAALARFDTANRLIEAISPRGRSTTYSWDALDRLTQRADALGGVTQYAYDDRDNVLSVTDANSHAVETNSYDLRNRLVQRLDANGKASSWQYDGNGNITQTTDRKGQIVSFQYDALNRVTQITYPDRTIAYSYDLASNISRLSDSVSGDILFAYDRLDRLIKVSSNQGSVEYQYDVIGRLTQRTINGTDPTTYAYDKVGRLKSIGYRGKTVSYSYDAAGRLTAKTLPNGVTAGYQYDDANRLTSLTYKDGNGALIDSLAYSYDENGNPIAKSQATNPASVPETPFTATYDAANRMLTWNGYALIYDDNGNLLSRGGPSGATTYTWDSRNQLTGISGPNGNASFKYDAFGRRVEKTVNGQTTGYLYDGSQAIAELSGSVIGTTYLTGMQIDEVLAKYAGSGNRTLLADALGSVIAQTDDNATTKSQYAYSPYGEAQTSGEAGNPLQYTGRENDATGLYFYRARYYDPQLKRFVSEDPIGLQGGINQYTYVRGNPISRADRLGLFDVLIGGGGSLVGGIGAEASAGIVINPGLGDECADVGVFGSIGGGGGLNISADAFVGFVSGPISSVSGETNNVNVSIGPLSVTVFLDPKSNSVLGGTVGLGPGLPAGVSVTKSLTGTATVNDLRPKQSSCGCKR